MNPIEMMNQANVQKQINGLVVAIVTNNKDPEGTGRIKIVYPWNKEEGESYWARIMSFMAGNDKGGLFLPEVGEEVLVAFEQGDMESPIILGALWSGKDRPPEKNSDGKNNIKMIKTRSGHEIRFDDSKRKEKIEIKSKSGHRITLDDKIGREEITIEDKSGSIIKMDSLMRKITIEANMIDIKAESVLTLKSKIIRIN
jgi:uncharacterized protein involved in type VI secretion and phage assembly